MNIDQALAGIEGVVKAASHRHAATDAFVSGCPKCGASVGAGLVLSGATDALALLVVQLGKALLVACEELEDWHGQFGSSGVTVGWVARMERSYDEAMDEISAAHTALLAFAETLGEVHDATS